MEHLGAKLAAPDFDAVPREVLIENRRDLLEEIQTAKGFFRALTE